MKKKIIIVTNKMVIGGVEKALISMLEEIDINAYDITLVCMESGGDLIDSIPKWVNLVCLEEFNINQRTKELLKYGKIYKASKCLFFKIYCRLEKDWIKQNIYITNQRRHILEKYDIAISYHTPTSITVPYVINNIKANKKIMWIHSDVNIFKNQMKKLNKYYYKYDNIVTVSSETTKAFIKLYPKLRKKISTIYNIISKSKINNLAKEPISLIDDEKECIRIVTVARVTDEKGYTLIPSIVRRLIDDRHNIQWYCVGDGIMMDKVKKLIDKYRVNNNIHMLGYKENPYPYIKICDIYVQPSLYECYCTTITEAKCLQKPIITTNVNGMKEQIKDRETGIIVDYDEESIYKAIKEMILDKALRQKLQYNLSKIEVDTKSEIHKLYNMI